MKISIQRINQDVLFEAENEAGVKTLVEGSPELGGTDQGCRPMQLVLTALGTCSSIDLVNILKKQKQQLDNLKIEVEAERQQDQTPALFESIHVHFFLSGKLDKRKVSRAIDLSLNKYCSVARILEQTANITHSFTIENPSS